MITPPTAPSPGKPVSAGFFARLIAWVKSGQLVEGRGYRLHRTPNGTALDIHAVGAKNSLTKIPGCFEIRPPTPAATEGGEDDPGGFDNPYYMVGGRIYCAANLHDFPISFEDEIVVLVVVLSGSSPTASIQSFSSFEEIQTLADNEDVAVYPLYEFGNGGKVAVDLRNMPTIVTREFAGS